MAVPKYKVSKSKTRSRRAANMKLERPDLSECSTCGSKIPSHRVCPKCGFYRGQQVIETEKLD